MKDIVFCADGTWDHPHQETDGVPSITNVRKFFKALVTGEHELPIYDDGVGVDGNPLEHLLGGAFGEGLLAKVKDGYKQIAAAYQPGDRIHIFGFSRGAYTARSLASMIVDYPRIQVHCKMRPMQHLRPIVNAKPIRMPFVPSYPSSANKKSPSQQSGSGTP